MAQLTGSLLSHSNEVSPTHTRELFHRDLAREMFGRIRTRNDDLGKIIDLRAGRKWTDHGYFVTGRVQALQNGVIERMMTPGGERENSEDVSGVSAERMSHEEVSECDHERLKS